MHADISVPHGAKERIGKGMAQHVRVGMPFQAGPLGNLHPAQHEPPVLGKPVNIEAYPCPYQRTALPHP